MNKTRWMIERKQFKDNEMRQVIEVYAPGENKQLVKQENKKYTYKKHLIILD